MATGFSDKVPPPFNGNTDDFAKWKRKYELWKQITEVAPTKQGSLLVLRLDEDTQDTILELLTSADLAKEDGADQVVKKLEDMHKKDASIAAFELYEQFEAYRRPTGMSINNYCSEFQKMLSKIKAIGTTLPDHVVALRLLKSANISETEERLVRAPITKMDGDTMIKPTSSQVIIVSPDRLTSSDKNTKA